ncbi:MAG: hypothetical protein U1F16_15170 [Turneriella sp.]
MVPTLKKILCSLCIFSLTPMQLWSNDELKFSHKIESQSFIGRSFIMGLGYMQQAYRINGNLDGNTGYPTYRYQSRPAEIDIKTEHILLQYAGLGPATYHNFWLGFATVMGYGFRTAGNSAQSIYPVRLNSIYLSHQQMIGYYFYDIRIYTMLGFTSDWLATAEMKSGDERLENVGADGIFVHSGGGIYYRVGPIVLNAELRIPVWRLHTNRQTPLHFLFSISYALFG